MSHFHRAIHRDYRILYNCRGLRFELLWAGFLALKWLHDALTRRLMVPTGEALSALIHRNAPAGEQVDTFFIDHCRW